MAASEFPVNTPLPGWAEQDPETWYQAAVDHRRRALESPGSLRPFAAIGLSGQMHGLIPLDAAGHPLRPAIIWADQRSQAQVERLRKEIKIENLGRWTANPLATGFMLPSWIWLCENEPDIAHQTACLLLPKDYLRFRLTGAWAASLAMHPPLPCSIPRTGAGAWSCWRRSTSIPASCHRSGNRPRSPAGCCPRPAAEMGLRPGTPVVFGGSDQSCQAIGHGVVEPGSFRARSAPAGSSWPPSSSHATTHSCACTCSAMPCPGAGTWKPPSSRPGFRSNGCAIRSSKGQD